MVVFNLLNIIAPLNTKIIIYNILVAKHVAPILESFYTSLAGKKAPDKSFLN